MKSSLALILIVLSGALLAERQPLSRYQSIIDRRPFGQPPPGYDPDSTASEAAAAAQNAARTPEALTQEQSQLQKAVSFSVMNINTDGSVSVGFSDRSDPKSPKHYYLKEGEEQNGWLVKSVDAAAKELVLVKDEIEVPLHLGDTAKPEAKAAGGRNAPARPLVAGRSGLLGARNMGEGNAPASFASRRLKRKQEEAAADQARADQEAERKRQAEEAAAKEAADKAAREEERAATRQQLQAIQEELRRAREEKQRREREQQEEGGNEDNAS